jgi:hypothetical protein
MEIAWDNILLVWGNTLSFVIGVIPIVVGIVLLVMMISAFARWVDRKAADRRVKEMELQYARERALNEARMEAREPLRRVGRY